MLFDIRGRRRNVVKVVYAVLAVLMGLSLFLVVGGFNIAELFNSNPSSGSTSQLYEEQAERLEVKLKKDPENPELLTALTRAYVNAGNSQVTVDSSGTQSFALDAVQQYENAYQAWSDYLEATNEPSAGLALVISPTLLRLAELSRSYPQAASRMKSATEAQQIVAEQRPSLNAFSTLAYYTYFTGDFEAGEEAREKALKLAPTKPEKEAIEKQLDEIRKNAKKFVKEKERAEKRAKAGAGTQGGSEAVEGGENPLGGALGGGLSE